MNSELIKNLTISYNYSKDTIASYNNALNKYSRYYGKSLQELLEEAEEDERNRVNWKHSRLRSKLIEYRHHLLQKYTYSTAKRYLSCVRVFYDFYDIEIGKLPKINKKAVKKTEPIYFKDLPDKEVIREAFKIASPLMKAIILFCCSSGCSRAETLSLTIQDYIDALSEYLPRNKRDIYEIIDYINELDNVIPTFNILRKKTNKYYTTYSSPESVKAINAYLLTRKDQLPLDGQLFRINRDYLGELYQNINDTLGLGRVGKYSRFRSHMLRKFHASALYNDGMSIDKVNDLQGKAKNKTDAVYFMTNPEDLKYEYIKHLPAITINTDVKKLSIKSPEFIQMENENKEYKNKLDKLADDMARIMERLPDDAK